MPFTNRNNYIRYDAVPITTIGGVNDDVAATGILARYDFIIVKPHTTGLVLGITPVVLDDVIRGVKAINKKTKVFGYTSLGDAASMAAWKLQVDQWVLDIPTQSVLDGIFIDKFGFTDGALATRDNQNIAVLYVYGKLLTEAPLQVAVSASDPVDALNALTGLADPKITTGAGVDYIVLDSFYFGGALPTPEAIEHMYGRLQYATAKATPPLAAATATVAPTSKLGVLLGASAGNGTLSIPLIDYAKIVNLAAIYPVAGLGIMPQDNGLLSHQYYYQNVANNFNQ